MASASAFSGGYVANAGPSVEGYLLPAIDDESGWFWEGTAAGELRVQVCGACGRWRHPPRPMCPSCRSVARDFVKTSGRGTVWSFEVSHPPLLPVYAALAPYNVIVVALDEESRIRFVGNLVTGPDGAINEIDPSTITIGEPVEVVFAHYDRVDGSAVYMPRWRRCPAS